MKKSRRKFLGAAFSVSAGLAVSSVAGGRAAGASANRPAPQVRTTEGTLRGIAQGNVDVFRGVRYGEDTAARRFRPPVAVKPWKGVREATVFGHPAPQIDPDPAGYADPMPPSEDCLFLNIFRPANAVRRPVMVWLHGGGHWWGSGTSPMWDGAALVEKGDVIVVTVNHRLNVFGYLYLGGLDASFADSANVFALDLAEALKWIQRNIAAFGGDPDQVTVFGESGGGMKVSALLAMPAAKGLFQRAIVQSGSLMEFRSQDDAKRDGIALLAELGLKPEDVGQLRTMPIDRLTAAYHKIVMLRGSWDVHSLPFAPTLHAGTLPYQPTDPAAVAVSHNVAVMTGSTEHEAIFPMTMDGPLPDPKDDAESVAIIQSHYPKIDPAAARSLIEMLRAAAPEFSRQRLLVNALSDLWMRRHVMHQAELRKDAAAPTYVFLFSWLDPLLNGRWAVHGADLPFMFDKLDQKFIYEPDYDAVAARTKLELDRHAGRLRDEMVAAWTNFARTGNPTSRLLAWPDYAQGRATMRLDAPSTVVRDPFGAQLRELEVALPPRLS